jgi:hypothetical protein
MAGERPGQLQRAVVHRAAGGDGADLGGEPLQHARGGLLPGHGAQQLRDLLRRAFARPQAAQECRIDAR